MFQIISIFWHISHSSVATFVRCGRIFNVDLIVNLEANLSVKELWKSVSIWWSYWQKCGYLFLLDHPVLRLLHLKQNNPKQFQNNSKTMCCFRRSYMWNKTLKQLQNVLGLFQSCFRVVLGSLAYLFARRKICKSQNSYSLWLVAKVYEQSDRWYETSINQ